VFKILSKDGGVQEIMNFKRFLAWTGIIILVALYAATLITACLSKKYAANMFWVSLYCTIIVPILMHFIIRIHSHVTERRDAFIEEAMKNGDNDNDSEE